MLAAALRSPAAAKLECCWQSPCARRIPGFQQWILPDGSESEQCPREMVTPFSSAMLSMHQHYRHGHLPAPGGLLAQPQWYLSAMEIIGGG